MICSTLALPILQAMKSAKMTSSIGMKRTIMDPVIDATMEKVIKKSITIPKIERQPLPADIARSLSLNT